MSCIRNRIIEIGMAFGGVAREEDDRSSGSIAVEGTVNQRPSDKDETQVVDYLIVLFSCSDSLKRQLSDLHPPRRQDQEREMGLICV